MSREVARERNRGRTLGAHPKHRYNISFVIVRYKRRGRHPSVQEMQEPAAVGRVVPRRADGRRAGGGGAPARAARAHGARRQRPLRAPRRRLPRRLPPAAGAVPRRAPRAPRPPGATHRTCLTRAILMLFQEVDLSGCDGVTEEVACAAVRALAAHPRRVTLHLAGTAAAVHNVLNINIFWQINFLCAIMHIAA